jgi:hypothetical protein
MYRESPYYTRLLFVEQFVQTLRLLFCSARSCVCMYCMYVYMLKIFPGDQRCWCWVKTCFRDLYHCYHCQRGSYRCHAATGGRPWSASQCRQRSSVSLNALNVLRSSVWPGESWSVLVTELIQWLSMTIILSCQVGPLSFFVAWRFL